MKQVIPFSKDIVFKTNIASITSISLEHEEKISDGEISGDFVVFGEYKIHNDTTEKELFKFKLPFTALIPDNVVPSTISIDVEDFTYETIEEDVLQVNINFSIEGEEREIVEEEKKEEEGREEPETVESFNETAVENELNFFLDDKILSNIANVEELREKRNAKGIEEETLDNEEEPKDVVETLVDKEEEEEKPIFQEGPIFRSVVKPVAEKIKEPAYPEEKESEEREIENVENPEPEKIETPVVEKVVEEKETIAYPEKTREEVKKDQAKKEERKEEESKIMMGAQDASSEYVTYHIHIVKMEETLDTIIKNYNSNLDVVSLYNDINSVKVGDKLIIPEYLDE